MDLCGGCFAAHGVRTPIGMKARHFVRRLSLQSTNLTTRRDRSIDSVPPTSPLPKSVLPPATPTRATRPTQHDRRHASGSAACAGDQENRPKKYRVVVMGSARVGKTAIINQFLYDSFTPKYTRTIEEMHHGEYEISSMCLTLEILDTSGSYEFPAMRELSIRAADAFILVYSVCDAASFEEVRNLREHILSIKRNPVPMVVVGNKVDLLAERVMPIETTETTVLMDWENGFMESSAKENFHVLQIFKELLNQAKIRYELSPAVKRRRQSMPNFGVHVTPAQLHHLNHLKMKNGSKRNSCSIQ